MPKFNEADISLLTKLELTKDQINTFYRIVAQVGAESGAIRGQAEGKAYLASLNKIPFLEKRKQQEQAVAALWHRLLSNREAAEKRFIDQYANWWSKAVAHREMRERIAENRRLAAEKRAADNYSNWWNRALMAREAREHAVEARKARDRQRYEASYESWWHRALAQREQREIASAKRIAKERERGNAVFAMGLPNTPQTITPKDLGGSGTNFLNLSWSMLGKIYAGIIAIRAAWYSIQWVTSSMTNLFKWGLEFNQTMQASVYGLAGLITSTAQLVDYQGKLVPETERWNAALSVSKRIVNDLVKASYTKTMAPVDMLMRGAQEGMGPMLSAGFRDSQIVPFITRAAQVMQALQIPLREIGQEIRSLLSGDANPRTARLGAWFKNNFFGGENYTKAINELKSTNRFFDEFMQKTVEVGKAGEVLFDTLAGSWARLKNMAQAAMGNETSALYVSLKNNINAITDALIRFDKDGKPVFNESVARAIQAIASAMESVVTSSVKLIDKIAGPGGLSETLSDFANRFAKDPIIVTIKAIWEGITPWGGQNKFGFTDEQIANFSPEERRRYNIASGKPELNMTQAQQSKLEKVTNGLWTWTDFYNSVMRKMSGAGSARPDSYSRFDWVSDYERSENGGKPLSEVQKRNSKVMQLVKMLGFDFTGSKYRIAGGSTKTEEETEELRNELHTVQQIILANKERFEKSSDISEVQKLQNKINAAGYRIDVERLNVLEQIRKLSDESISKAGKTRVGLIDEVNSSFGVERRETIGAINNEYWFKLIANAKTFADIYTQMTKEQEKADKEFQKTLKEGRSISELYGPYYKQIEENEKRLKQANARKAKETFTLEEQKAKVYWDAIEKRTKIFMRSMSEGLTNMAQGFVSGGIKGLLNEAGRGFSLIVGDSMQSLISKFVTYWGISEVTNDQGQVVGWKNRSTNDVWNTPEEAAANRKGANKAAIGVQLAQIGLGSYANARANYKGSITQGAIGGALSGAMFGGAMAAIGALVGGLSAAIGKAQTRSEYKFGRFGVNEFGEAYGYNVKNLNPQEVLKMIADTQSTFDEFYNSYVELVMKLPNYVIPKLTGIQADFQKEASANYLKHWDEWISGTLPDTIAKKFQDGMRDAAVSMGMSVDKFNQMWTKLDKLDPKKSVELWGIAFDAMSKIRESMGFFGFTVGGTPNKGRQRAVGRVDTNVWDRYSPVLRAERTESFIDQMRRADEQIYELGEKMQNLTGEAQIRAAQQLGDLMVERMEKEKEYMRQLIALSEEVSKQVAATIDEWTAEGLKNEDGTANYEKQAQFWKEKADAYLNQMNTALTPEAAKEAWDNYYAAINKVKELMSQYGPNNAEEIRKWAIDALKHGEAIFKNAIEKMGERLGDLNTEFKSKIEPFLNTFLSVMEETGGAFEDILDPIRELPEDIDRVRDKFNDLEGTIGMVNGALQLFGGLLGGGPNVSSNGFTSAAIARRNS